MLFFCLCSRHLPRQHDRLPPDRGQPGRDRNCGELRVHWRRSGAFFVTSFVCVVCSFCCCERRLHWCRSGTFFFASVVSMAPLRCDLCCEPRVCCIFFLLLRASSPLHWCRAGASFIASVVFIGAAPVRSQFCRLRRVEFPSTPCGISQYFL